MAFVNENVGVYKSQPPSHPPSVITYLYTWLWTVLEIFHGFSLQ